MQERILNRNIISMYWNWAETIQVHVNSAVFAHFFAYNNKTTKY